MEIEALPFFANLPAMAEEIYRYSKTKFGIFPKVVSILTIIFFGTGNFTFGDSDRNFAPFIAALVIIIEFKTLIWDWKPKRWNLTLGPKALIFEEGGKHTSIQKKDIARILASPTKRGKQEYILLESNGSYHVIPHPCIGNQRKFEKTMTDLGYPLEKVTA